MALTESNGGGLSAADVAAVVDNRGYGWGYPMMAGYGMGSGLGFGGDATWLIILFLFAAMGGWGNGFGGGFGGGNGSVYPWMLANNTDGLVTTGFANANTTSLLGDIQNQITTGFANAEVAGCNRAMDAMQTAYGNQIASMNQRFADTTALNGQLNNLAMGLQNCCCENRASIADLKYTVATEACADRAAVNDALRDVITANTASTQRILDQLCQDKIDAKNEKIAELQNQLNMANLAASQTAQTAAIKAGQTAEIDAMYNRLRDCPVPTMPVYGNQPIFTCGSGTGCGCTGGFNGNFQEIVYGRVYV